MFSLHTHHTGFFFCVVFETDPLLKKLKWGRIPLPNVDKLFDGGLERDDMDLSPANQSLTAAAQNDSLSTSPSANRNRSDDLPREQVMGGRKTSESSDHQLP